MDYLSLLHDFLADFGAPPVVIPTVILLLAGAALLVRAYAPDFWSHLLHKRNVVWLALILVFGALLCLMGFFDVFSRIPMWLSVVLAVLYALYVAAVLWSVKSPVFPAGMLLRRYRERLYRGEMHEYRTFVEKKPWWIVDADERIAYQRLKMSYLAELGDIRRAYQAVSEIDESLLYPEERAKIAVSRAYLLIAMGDIQRAEDTVEMLKDADKPAYFFLRSHLLEIWGKSEDAWQAIQQAEATIPQGYKRHDILTPLYTQLGRMAFSRNNVTELFRYYHMALAEAKLCDDKRMLHATYQNLLFQIKLQKQHEDEFEPLKSEYLSRLFGDDASLNNKLEVVNTLVGLARVENDRDGEYDAIASGYENLHDCTSPPEQYLVEISTLCMLCNGGFSIDLVWGDLAAHFDDYFHIPMPGRIRFLMEFRLPRKLTAEQRSYADRWSRQLEAYGTGDALLDLAKYEQTLKSEDVNERCWVLHQRTEFVKRSAEPYDGEQVCRWIKDLIQISENSRQLARTVEGKVDLAIEYDHQRAIGLRADDDVTESMIRDTIREAYVMSGALPKNTVAAALINIAYYSAAQGDLEQARAALSDFKQSMQPINGFSQELQKKYEAAQELFSVL